jgi:outer membrane protein OmpA-like peptidoglycan-associated protein
MYRSITIFYAIFFCLMSGSVFAANTLSTGGHDGIVRTQSADPMGVGTFNLGGAIEYGQDGEYIHSKAPNLNSDGSPRMVSGVGTIAYGLAPIFDLGLNLPAYYDNPQFGTVHPRGIGDLELSAKLSGFYLKGEDKILTTAYYLSFQFPTGDKTKGFFPRHVYYAGENHYSTGNTLVHPMLISTIHFDRIKGGAPIQLHLNCGGVFNAPKDHNALTGSIGLEYLPNDIWTLFVEASGEERIGSVHSETFTSDLNNNPWFITPGVKIKIPTSNVFLTLAADFGISESDPNAALTSISETGVTIKHRANMAYNAYFAINWLIPGFRDDDGDGIGNKQDSCPKVAEDKDGFQDNDGCPDYDNDKDGVPDSLDKCPNQAGPVENKGCPDVDTDKDGIVDRLDKCPNKAGIQENDGCPDVDTDKDGVVDRLDKCPDKAGPAENKGCPDIDTDNDGVVDRLDKCPNEKEDKDGFQDDDGCPDYDNDGDGIPDSVDKCPNNPGTPETKGCPKTKEIRGALVLKGVNFESGKDILKSYSFTALDQIAESLREWPEVKVEVSGHTDNIGDATFNQDLSQRRAETVRMYLVNKGIAADRLTAIGYGPEKPIASNKTSAGRAQNRRVELNRTN